jgi:hypothetical protein
VHQWLSESYPGSRIGLGLEAPVSCPARSPDFIPVEFSPWGCLGTKFYVGTVDTREELWRQIKLFASEIKNIPEIFERLRVSFSHKSDLGILEHGSHFEHFLYRSKNK